MSTLNNPLLRSKIDELWKKFWAGGISNPLLAIEQITFLLFMKKLDLLDTEQTKKAKFADEKLPERFQGFWIPPEFRNEKDPDQHQIPKSELRWSHFSQIKKADQMLNWVSTRVFPFLKELNHEKSAFSRHMQNAVFIIPKPSLLVEAITTINEIFDEIDRESREQNHNFHDIQGDVYEYLLSEIASAGKNGQFRTPRHIIRLVAELVDPKLGANICDPACGSAGFLLGAYQHILAKLIKMDGGELSIDEDGFEHGTASKSLNPERKALLSDSLHGFDIDQSMVRMGLMNLIMHGIDEPQLDYSDTLSKTFDNHEEQFQYILANPPFTGNLDKGDINKNLKSGTTKTELLFLENIYRMLNKGGTAGVIIPQGVLFGTGKAFVTVRQILTERCQLKAVISMPSGVFKPYAGVATAILIFTKVYNSDDTITAQATQSTFFYDMKADGYSLDDKRTKQGNSDLQNIISQYQNREANDLSDRKKQYFSVPFDEIKGKKYDLSFSRYKEEVFEEVDYGDPQDLINQLILAEIGTTPAIEAARLAAEKDDSEAAQQQLSDLQEQLVTEQLQALKDNTQHLQHGILKELIALKEMVG